MIGRLTDNLKDGQNIENIINKKKIIQYSEKRWCVDGFKEIMYIYSDEKIKKEHEEKMFADNWKIINGQSNVAIYHSFYKEESIYKPCSIFQKEIKSSLMISSSIE